ncbi:hypothetical protein MY5147_005390 [Beauveria neobassiana]
MAPAPPNVKPKTNLIHAPASYARIRRQSQNAPNNSPLNTESASRNTYEQPSFNTGRLPPVNASHAPPPEKASTFAGIARAAHETQPGNRKIAPKAAPGRPRAPRNDKRVLIRLQKDSTIFDKGLQIQLAIRDRLHLQLADVALAHTVQDPQNVLPSQNAQHMAAEHSLRLNRAMPSSKAKLLQETPGTERTGAENHAPTVIESQHSTVEEGNTGDLGEPDLSEGSMDTDGEVEEQDEEDGGEDEENEEIEETIPLPPLLPLTQPATEQNTTSQPQTARITSIITAKQPTIKAAVLRRMQRRPTTIDLAFSNIDQASAVVEEYLTTGSLHYTVCIEVLAAEIPQRVISRYKVSLGEEVEDFVAQVKTAVTSLQPSLDSHENIEQTTTTLSNIIETAIRTCGHRQNNHKVGKNPWWNKERADALLDYRVLWRTTESFTGQETQHARICFKRTVRRVQRDFWSGVIADITAPDDVYKVTRWLKPRQRISPPPIQVGE